MARAFYSLLWDCRHHEEKGDSEARGKWENKRRKKKKRKKKQKNKTKPLLF
jgi:hypothetical protein